MADKSTALGTLVRIDYAGGTTYATVGRIKATQPPANTGTEADGKCLTDTFDVPLVGIEGPSEFTYTMYWSPGETIDTSVDTAFTNRREAAGASGGVLGVQLCYPHDGTASGSTMPTQTFDARVLSVSPATLDEPNAVFTRDVTCRRITDITAGTYLVP